MTVFPRRRPRSRYIGRHRRRRVWRPVFVRGLRRAALLAAGVALLAVLPGAHAYAAEVDTSTVVYAAPQSIQEVVNNMRLWLLSILAAVATFFLTVGGLRYVAANGDPGEVEKAKASLRSAAIGYALALLAPLFVTIVGGWVK